MEKLIYFNKIQKITEQFFQISEKVKQIDLKKNFYILNQIITKILNLKLLTIIKILIKLMQ